MYIIVITNLIMKKLIGLKNINTIFTDRINELNEELQDNLKEIKLEYQQNITEEKIKLLIAICNGEGLSIDDIKLKYLKPKELEFIEPNESTKNTINIDDNLLDKIIINDQDYYYEPVNNGIVYNIDNQPVGTYKNGKVIFS